MSTRPELPVSRQSLAGEWELRRDGQARWRPVSLPAAWEAAGIPRQAPGPFWYRKLFTVPPATSARRCWLRFTAVSYDCQVWVNGQPVGEHRGLWDEFTLEITSAVRPGEPAELLLRVEKPASLTAGPDSPPVPGNFPLRQTLSGFLPYVWGHIFGGIWQDVELVTSGAAAITSLYACGDPTGQVRLEWSLDLSGGHSLPLQLTITDPAGSLVLQTRLDGREASGAWVGSLPGPQPWSLHQPDMYTACLRLSLPDGALSDVRCQRFGLKSFCAQDARLLLNGQPVYPRLALSWGWYPDHLDANPGADQVRRDLLQLKALGYNGVKLCLWFPPAYYFDLADELGMLLWVELPLWLPEDSLFFRQQSAQEYARLAHLARRHPSVVLYTLGCELARQVDPAYLDGLYGTLQALAAAPPGVAPQALLCDNSGSGEAYGGWLEGRAQFYDHHFYCEPHFLRSLLDAFRPGWRQPKPWLMGEFCDYDTLRPLPALQAAHRGKLPWWADPDPQINPQGARWEMRLAGHSAALRSTGLLAQWDDLLAASHRQGLLHRKITLESVRSTPELSGYVVTGERDTPVSTAGMWDDLGQLKFDPQAWRAFNQDTVLCLGFDRRRTWTAGGDRPLSLERFNYRAGEELRLHLLVSHYGAYSGPARLCWQVSRVEPPGSAGAPALFASGESELTLQPGGVQEAGLVAVRLPPVAHPQGCLLQADLLLPEAAGLPSALITHNSWPFWVYPADPWAGVAPFGWLDPQGSLAGLERLAGKLACPGLRATHTAVCTAWTQAVRTFVRHGGRVVLLQQAGGLPGPLPVEQVPFWREALKLALPHPAWGDFPYQDPGLQLYGLAPDCALDAAGLPPSTAWKPLLRRLDTRSLQLHEYLLELSYGSGQVLLTTLRLSGGLGDQPSTLRHNLAGQWLLAAWLRYLQRTASQKTA